MKKEVMNFIKSLGGIPKYAGNTVRTIAERDWNNDIVFSTRGSSQTMYIIDPEDTHKIGKQTIEECVFNKFGFELPFKIITQ